MGTMFLENRFCRLGAKLLFDGATVKRFEYFPTRGSAYGMNVVSAAGLQLVKVLIESTRKKGAQATCSLYEEYHADELLVVCDLGVLDKA